MVRLDLVRDKVRRLRSTLELLRRCLPAESSALSHPDLRDLVSFRVYLGMQEAIDLASHVIADEGWGPAPSLRDQFGILSDKGVLEASLAGRLASGVKVRNLIGHAYADIDAGKLHAAAGELATVLDAYCAAVLSFAESELD